MINAEDFFNALKKAVKDTKDLPPIICDDEFFERLPPEVKKLYYTPKEEDQQWDNEQKED